MPTVSDQLRQARESQSLSVQQVAEATKIKSDHVRALDDGNFDAFTAPIYIRGFVRSYANLLKLDVPGILTLLDQELTQTRNFSGPPPLTVPERTWLDKLMYHLSKLKWRFLLPLAGVILLSWGVMVGVKAWRKSKTEDPLKDLKPGLHQSRSGGESEYLLQQPAPRR